MINNNACSNAWCRERKGYPHRILKGSSPAKKDGMGKIYPKKTTTLKNTGGANKSKRFPAIRCISEGKLSKIISIITVNSKKFFVIKAKQIKMHIMIDKERIHRIDKGLRMDVIIYPKRPFFKLSTFFEEFMEWSLQDTNFRSVVRAAMGISTQLCTGARELLPYGNSTGERVVAPYYP
jgi:hypothetical protein